MPDPATARHLLEKDRVSLAKVCGFSNRELAAKFTLRSKTITHFRRVLAELLAIAEENGSPAREAFSRFGKYPDAWKRVQSKRASRKLAERRAESERGR